MEKITALLSENSALSKQKSFLEALILLSNEDYEKQEVSRYPQLVFDHIHASRRRLEANNINWRSAAIEARYSWIQKILKDIVKKTQERKVSASDKIDYFVTHRVWGWVIFIGLMALMFLSIFSLATYPMDWINSIFAHF